MIKPHELRRGNVFLNSKGKIEAIENIYEDMVNPDVSHFTMEIEGDTFEQINPIPITPDWLRKFGFITLDAETDIEVWGMDDNSNGEEFSIVSDGLDTPTPLYFEYDLGYRNVRKEIKSLHQLQNLYFDLIGEELTIKETV